MDQSLYLMLDSKGNPIARGRVQGNTGGQYWQIQVEDGKIDEILEHKTLLLLSMLDSEPSYQGIIVRSRNDMIQLEISKVDRDSNDMRKNLRVPVQVDSFAYPLSGSWRGRRAVETHDLSCGGVAFHTEQALKVGEVVQIVLPVTDSPLLLRAKVLRELDAEAPDRLYAARFVDLCLDEEMAIRKAVFEIQVSKPRAKT